MVYFKSKIYQTFFKDNIVLLFLFSSDHSFSVSVYPLVWMQPLLLLLVMAFSGFKASLAVCRSEMCNHSHNQSKSDCPCINYKL